MRIRPLLVAIALSLLAACGGGSAGGYSTGGGSGGSSTVAVEGTWTGTTHVVGVTGSASIVGGIAQGGFAFFYSGTGDLTVLPPLGNSASVTGNVAIFAAQGTIFPNGKSIETFPVTIAVTSTSISGSITNGASTTDFELTPASPFTGTPSVVGGNWQGFYLDHAVSPPSIALTVQSGGVFAGNDANGCHLTGTITPLQSGEDLFVVAVDSTGAATCQGKLAGLAYEANTDDRDFFGGTTGIYYYVAVSNATSGFVAELKVQ